MPAPAKRSRSTRLGSRRFRPVSDRGSGPKGIRTPDLLAASQNHPVNGVLTCINAGRERAGTAKLWGVVSPYPTGRHDALISGEVVGGCRSSRDERRIGLPDRPALGAGPWRDVELLPTLRQGTAVLFHVAHEGNVASRDRSPPGVTGALQPSEHHPTRKDGTDALLRSHARITELHLGRVGDAHTRE